MPALPQEPFWSFRQKAHGGLGSRLVADKQHQGTWMHLPSFCVHVYDSGRASYFTSYLSVSKHSGENGNLFRLCEFLTFTSPNGISETSKPNFSCLVFEGGLEGFRHRNRLLYDNSHSWFRLIRVQNRALSTFATSVWESYISYYEIRTRKCFI